MDDGLQFDFDEISIENWLEIVNYLDTRDLLILSQVNSSLRQLFIEDLLWESQLLGPQVTQSRVNELIHEAGLTSFDPHTTNQYRAHALIILKSQNQTSMEEEEDTSLSKARDLLMDFRNNQDLDTLYNSITLSYDTIPFKPLESLYLLAFTAYIINAPTQTKLLAELGLEFDDGFEPLLELKEEAENLIKNLGGEGKAPLILNNDLSPEMKACVKLIFHQFISPGTRKLSLLNLAALITKTNHGQPPPREFVNHVFDSFAQGTNRARGIDYANFELFYFNLAMADPEETRNDLAGLGFGPNTLKLVDQAVDQATATLNSLAL